MKALLFLILILITACSTQNTEQQVQELKIATAANMQFAIKEIAQAFTQQTEIKCDIIVGSSGKLTAQIQEGAPYDVFISANMMYPKALEKNNKTKGKTKVYAHGKLVMWSMKENVELSYENLNTSPIKHIAVANPETAPYGKAAVEILKVLPYFDSIQSKFVYGESIAQTNQFIVTSSAEIGFTALSAVLSPAMKDKGSWILVDSTLYSPIQQGAVVIDTENPTSSTFFDFLSLPKAKTILRKYGYEIME